MSSVPQTYMNDRVVRFGMGFCVGGSSAINGMAVMRGTKADYDIWAALGEEDSTWDWDGMLPYYKKVGSALFAAGIAKLISPGPPLRTPERRVCGRL